MLLAEAAGGDLAAQAGVGLVRGDVADAGVVVLVVIPVKVSFKIIAGLAVI